MVSKHFCRVVVCKNIKVNFLIYSFNFISFILITFYKLFIVFFF